jgi:hypothetical protein
MLLHSVAEIVIIMFVFDGLVPFFVQTFFGNKICLPPSDWCIPLLGQDQKIFKKSKKVNQGHHSKRWVAIERFFGHFVRITKTRNRKQEI